MFAQLYVADKRSLPTASSIHSQRPSLLNAVLASGQRVLDSTATLQVAEYCSSHHDVCNCCVIHGPSAAMDLGRVDADGSTAIGLAVVDYAEGGKATGLAIAGFE